MDGVFVVFFFLITHSRCGACRKVGRIMADFRQITIDSYLALVKRCVGDAMDASFSYDALIITSLKNKKLSLAEMKYFSHFVNSVDEMPAMVGRWRWWYF